MISRFSRLVEFSTLEDKCAYLPNKNMRMEYKYIQNCPQMLNEKLVQRGWRRFGEYYSRPNCKDCNACESLRIDARNFEFSKSDRRTLRKNTQTKILIQSPTLTQAHLGLYEKYHAYMEDKKGWKHYSLSPNSYHELYVRGCMNFGKEVLYFRDNNLVGVDLIDILSDGISSIYFFYDPDFAHLSLGRFSIYQQILLAKNHKLPWIYLGYFVADCDSLKYKADYTPHQILQNNPELNDEPIWNNPQA